MTRYEVIDCPVPGCDIKHGIRLASRSAGDRRARLGAASHQLTEVRGTSSPSRGSGLTGRRSPRAASAPAPLGAEATPASRSGHDAALPGARRGRSGALGRSEDTAGGGS